jgi:hypothetical protein
MHRYERESDELKTHVDERASERTERSGQEQNRAAPRREAGDAYGCVDWFDYDPAEARKRRTAH